MFFLQYFLADWNRKKIAQMVGQDVDSSGEEDGGPGEDSEDED